MESILIVGVVAAIGVLLLAGGFLLGYHRGIQYAQLPLAREVLPLAGSSAAHEGACAVHKLAGEVGGDRDGDPLLFGTPPEGPLLRVTAAAVAIGLGELVIAR